MTSRSHSPSYQSHLLRMWLEQPARCTPVWRFSLEEVGSGQRTGFADLDALLLHLLALMEEHAGPGRCTSATGDEP
jgi:hypothetical protein